MSKHVPTVIEIDSTITKIDAAVKTVFSGPRSQLRAIFQQECVLLNGKTCTNPGTPVKPGDTVTVNYDTHRKYKEKPKPYTSRAFELVYEDDSVLIADKQPGILSMPGDGGESNTLLDWINDYLKRQRVEALAVHRLDRDTSGLLVFAKTHPAWKALKEQFADKKPARLYDAIARGVVEPAEGTIRSYLATDVALNQRSVRNSTEGKLAVTHYRVERVLDDATWLKVTLETGRRNQIRVHFAEQRNPILGDSRYQPELAAHPRWLSKYLALHASELGFMHPITGEAMKFSSALPGRIRKFIESTPRGKRNA